MVLHRKPIVLLTRTFDLPSKTIHSPSETSSKQEHRKRRLRRPKTAHGRLEASTGVPRVCLGVFCRIHGPDRKQVKICQSHRHRHSRSHRHSHSNHKPAAAAATDTATAATAAATATPATATAKATASTAATAATPATAGTTAMTVAVAVAVAVVQTGADANHLRNPSDG